MNEFESPSPTWNFEITEDIINLSFKIVCGKRFAARSATNNTDTQRLLVTQAALVECYTRHGFRDLKFDTKLSLSHILAEANVTMQTSYKNNIVHYPKYVKRYVLCHILRSMGTDEFHRATKELKAKATTISSAIISQRAFNNEFGLDVEHIKQVVLVVARNGGRRNGWDYIFAMVRINRALEEEFGGVVNYVPLFSPLPLRSSMTPGFIRINTAGLMDLLLPTKESVQQFARDCAVMTPFDVRARMLDKKDVNLGLEKLVSRAVTDAEKIAFMRFKWEYFCKFRNKKYSDILECDRKGVTWGFDHAILTDGYSVNFQVSPQYDQLKTFAKRCAAKRTTAKEKQEKKAKKQEALQEKRRDFSLEEFPHCDDPSMVYNPDIKYLTGDPGKDDLLAVSDGFRSIRLTSATVNKASHKKARDRAGKKIRDSLKTLVGDMSVSQYETHELARYSKKSCVSSTFKGHLSKRFPYETSARQVYSKPLFRQSKFTVYRAKKSMVRKFINRIIETFKTPANTTKRKWMAKCERPLNHIYENGKKETTNLVLLYGDWGRNPNLRNSAPTPGIGLRRQIHKVIPTMTLDEKNTSKTCPCCMKLSLINPLMSVKCVDGSYRLKEKHSLRLCTSVGCMCRRWNRNVSASYVMMEKDLTALYNRASTSDT